MPQFLAEFIAAHPFVAVLLSPVWAAVLIDLMAFRNAKDPGNWWAQFSVATALWRYTQGFVGGVIGVAGMAGAAAAIGAGAVALLLYVR